MSEKKEPVKIMLIKENLFQSAVKDFVTFGFLFGMFFLNHLYCGGEWMIDLIAAVFIIMGSASRIKRNEYTIKEARAYLDKLAADSSPNTPHGETVEQ